MLVERMHLVARLCFGCWLLQVCGAGNITCTVTHGPNQTTYSVSDVEEDCDLYSWNNSSNHVLAIMDHKHDSVTSATLSTLITSECIPEVNYKRYCSSEGEEQTSKCNSVCPEKVAPRNDDAAETEKNTWITPVTIIIPVVIIILVCAGVFLFWKYRLRDRNLL